MKRKLNDRAATSALEKADRLRKTELRKTKFVHGAGAKDALAQGARSATYTMVDISQEKWDLCFMDDEEFERTYGRTKDGKKKSRTATQAKDSGA